MFEEGKLPNHVLVNEYTPGQGIMVCLCVTIHVKLCATVTVSHMKMVLCTHPLWQPSVLALTHCLTFTLLSVLKTMTRYGHTTLLQSPTIMPITTVTIRNAKACTILMSDEYPFHLTNQ